MAKTVIITGMVVMATTATVTESLLAKALSDQGFFHVPSIWMAPAGGACWPGKSATKNLPSACSCRYN